MPDKVKLVILFSGKRKCGKDYVTGKLIERLGDEAQVIRISEPIKAAWAKRLNLSLTELLGDGPYKEKYRRDMIEWSEKVRREDPGYFCREAMKDASKSIIIVSDIRRKTDVAWFKENYGGRIRTVRIHAADTVRSERGWVFTEGVDNISSECDLDDYAPWDLLIDNGDRTEAKKGLVKLFEFVGKSVSSL